MVVAACKSSAPPASPGPLRSADAGTATVTEDEILARNQPEALANAEQTRLVDRALCGKAGCCVTQIWDAGRDRKGRSLVVARVAMDGADCLVPRPRPPEAFGSGKLDLVRSPLRKRPQGETSQTTAESPDASPQDPATTSEDEVECRAFDYNLVIIDKKKVRGTYVLSDECNNGYGVAGVGEDSIEVSSETHSFSHTREGGSNWRWTAGVDIALDPPRLLSAYQSDYWNIKPNSSGSSMNTDWEHFKRSETWTVQVCGEREKGRTAAEGEGEAKQEGEEEGNDEDEDDDTGKGQEADSIPRLDLPAAFTGGGWKTTALGRCALVIDGIEPPTPDPGQPAPARRGYTLHGATTGPRDASLRVVSSAEGVLFVEVTDDKWTGPSGSWVKDDHLELWLSSVSTIPDSCDGDEGPAGADTAVQWGVRIADGAVFPAHGSPEPLKGIEVVRRGKIARLRIPFEASLGDETRFAVVYSDSDDGKKQKSLITTATLERGHGETMGRAWKVDPAQATCAVKRGSLVVVRTPPKPDEAIAQPESVSQ